MSLIVLMGPPAAGKSTWAASLQGVDIVSVDEIRAELGKPRHVTAFTAAYRRTETLLAMGHTVVFDSTAVTPAVRRSLRRIAKRRGLPVHLVVVHAADAACRRRNMKRECVVPEANRKAIHADYDRQYPVAVGAERWSSVRVVVSERPKVAAA